MAGPGGVSPMAVLALSAGTMAMTIDGTIMSAAMPRLAADLHVKAATAVLIITIYQLVTLIAVLPLAALGGMIGQRRLYQTGLVVFSIGSVLCAFAPAFPLLIAMRALQAFGASATLAASSAMIRSTYPMKALGRGLGFNSVIAASTASLAPILGGLILGGVGWPWLFVVGVPLAVASLASGAASLPETERRPVRYDFLAAALYAVALGLIAFALQVLVSSGGVWLAAGLGMGGLAIGAVFAVREWEKHDPILPFDLLRARPIALSATASLTAYIAVVILLIALPFRLQTVGGFTVATAAAVLAPMPLVSVVAAPLGGALSDRMPAGLIGGVGMVVATLGALLLAILPAAPTQLDVLWRVAICGVGFGVSFSPIARQLIAAAPVSRTAAAGALGTTIRGLGQTLGATAVSALFALHTGRTSIPMMGVTVLCAAAAVFCAATLIPEKPRAG